MEGGTDNLAATTHLEDKMMSKRTLMAAALAGSAIAIAPASAQIAGETNFESPLPYFKDLTAWDPAYTAPRTAFGAPDFQGVWSTASLTTLTRGGRNSSLGDELVIPQEKIDELTYNSYYNQRLRDDNQPTDASETAGDGQGGKDVKGYNNFWIDPGSEYAKVNGEYRSSWIVYPQNGQLPYSAEGRRARGARMAAFRGSENTGPEVRTIGDRCLISFGNQGGPPMNNAMYNNHIQITQTPGYIVLNIEMNHDARVIPIRSGDDTVERRPADLKQWFGDSIGWWEGDTLVVETRRLHPIQANGYIPISEEGVVTERFTRVSEQEIFYEYTVDDPENYSDVWKGEMPLRRSNERLHEYACHEGNYALPGILRGMAIGQDTAIEAEGE